MGTALLRKLIKINGIMSRDRDQGTTPSISMAAKVVKCDTLTLHVQLPRPPSSPISAPRQCPARSGTWRRQAMSNQVFSLVVHKSEPLPADSACYSTHHHTSFAQACPGRPRELMLCGSTAVMYTDELGLGFEHADIVHTQNQHLSDELGARRMVQVEGWERIESAVKTSRPIGSGAWLP